MRFPVCGVRTERLLPKIPPDYYHNLNSIIECTVEEAQSIYNKFRALAPTGRLTLFNFQECLGLFGTLARLLGERMFKAFDLNNDDYLDFVEFASSLLIMTKGSDDKKLALSYRILHPNPHTLPPGLIGSFDCRSRGQTSSIESRLDSIKTNSSYENASLNLFQSEEQNKTKHAKTKEDSTSSTARSDDNKEDNTKDENKETHKETEKKKKEPDSKRQESETERSSSMSFLRKTTETIINTTRIITSNISEMGQDRTKQFSLDEDSGIQFGEFVDVVNDIALTKALLVCRDPRYYTTEEIRKVFQKYASVSREGIQRLTQADYLNAVCESSEFLELLGVSLSQYAVETVSSSYKGVNLFLQKINATTRSYINKSHVKKKNVYKWINNSESKRGLSVHFGHDSWNHVVNMMIGLSISARYVYSQEEQPLTDEDYNLKLCFDIVENSQGLNVTKYITNTGLSSSRFNNLREYSDAVSQNKDTNKEHQGLNKKTNGIYKEREESEGKFKSKTRQESDGKLKSKARQESGYDISKLNRDDVASSASLNRDQAVSSSNLSREYMKSSSSLNRDNVISSTSLNIISNMSNSSLISSDIDFRFTRFYKENLKMGNGFSYIIKSKMVFKEYAPMVFRQIRKISGLSEKDYIESVSPEQIVGSMVLGNLSTMSELMSEGKSGALFYYTINGRLIVKTITKRCAKFVKSWLYRYYEHLLKNPDSILTRFYGLFSMENKLQKTKVYFITMNNVFYSRVSVHRRFDLKGSWVGRRLDPVELKDPTVALKDQDFDKTGEIILLGNNNKEFLDILKKDVLFLSESNLLDYSLLLGIHYREQSKDNVNWDDEQASVPGDQHRKMSDNKTRIYYMGIVDLLTPWNFTKRVEHLWRMIQTNDHQGVSCVNPNFYSSRFIQFIENHVQ